MIVALPVGIFVGVVPRVIRGRTVAVINTATAAPTAGCIFTLTFWLVRLGVFVGPIRWGLVSVEFFTGGHHVSEVVVHNHVSNIP